MAGHIDDPGLDPILDPDALYAPTYKRLTEAEITEFFNDIDSDGDGYIKEADLRSKFQEVYNHISSQSNVGPNNSSAAANSSFVESEHEDLRAFLHSLLPNDPSEIDKATFIKLAQKWNIPSRLQTSPDNKDQDRQVEEYEQRLPWRRRIKAYWSVEGPKILSMMFVIVLQISFGVWQGVKYLRNYEVRAALGWGVIMAKFAAGALYPTLFFVFLSMSRWFSTRMRRFERFSRFIGWDHQQAFHIITCCEAFVLSWIHSIGHLTGSFVYGSRSAQQDDLSVIFGPHASRKSYGDFIATRPGWSGLAALGMFVIIVACSMPMIRRRWYEVFQLSHLLMYPFAAMLCLHGTAALLSHPALGYVIAFPLLLVILERLYRFARGFIKIRARMTLLDENTVVITCRFQKGKNWRNRTGRFSFFQLPSMSRWYHPGQYIFLQVPSISRWQWHPFTISMCRENQLQIHIKCEPGASWTRRLRDLPEGKDFYVGLDGPFGAPAQRFYNYDRSVIIGAGIGVTPFSAILADLEDKVGGEEEDPFHSIRSSRQPSLTPDLQLSLSPFSPMSWTPIDRLSVGPSSRRGTPGRSRAETPSISREPSPIPLVSVVSKQPFVADGISGLKAAEISPGSTEATAVDTRKPSVSTGKFPSYASSFKAPVSRRVDFVWSVRERKDLLWFSPLLNRVHDLASRAAPSLQIKARLFVTARQNDISVHVFRHLLDRYKSKSKSQVTGLKIETNFGRPNLQAMLRDFHQDMRREAFNGRVGVFFCGSAAIGRILSDTCRELTARAQADGSGIRYVFIMEVFG